MSERHRPHGPLPDQETVHHALAVKGAHRLCLSCGQAELALLGYDRQLVTFFCPHCGWVTQYRTDVLGV